ncbi:hypothetical protein M0R45_008531 [Rubus argutus]|uniref:Uncharacterized protein n=1 Tax=Rubus argutus TaxID=59490 RepID=A0AAW1Y2B2_RUBAR
MVRQVNSFSELFQKGHSESQIFEGLAEIVPPSVLGSIEASTPIVSQPQLLQQVPIQAAESPVQPGAGLEAPTEVVNPGNKSLHQGEYSPKQKTNRTVR